MKADAFLADHGYDSDAIVDAVRDTGMEAVIPPRANLKFAQDYDKYL